MSDEELYVLVKGGDSAALNQLYDRYSARVTAIVRHKTGDRQLIEEVVQDVFMRIWTTQAFDPTRGVFGHWICIVARNATIDRLRKQPAEPELEVPETLSDNKSAYDQRMLRDDLVESLSRLRNEERQVLECAYFEGLTLTEIAERLDVPLGTIKSRLHAGLKHMRSTMSDWQEEVTS